MVLCLLLGPAFDISGSDAKKKNLPSRDNTKINSTLSLAFPVVTRKVIQNKKGFVSQLLGVLPADSLVLRLVPLE